MSGSASDYANVRKKIRTYRKNLSSKAVSQTSSIISEKIIQHSAFLKAVHIAYYVSDENEIDPAFIATRARELNKQIYLPVLSEKNNLLFYLITKNTKFSKNKLGIIEPDISNQKNISPKKLDLILIPLVAFDQDCNRLGRGLGCYDRALQFTLKLPREKCPLLVGLAYEFQRVKKIIPENWDVKMDFIATEKRVYSMR